MDLIWPSRNWIDLDGNKYQIADQFEFSSPFPTGHQETLIPFSNGGILLSFHNSRIGTIKFYTNDGLQVLSSPCGDITDFSQRIFWLDNGNIGFLHNDSSITITNSYVDVIDVIPAPEPDLLILQHCVFPNGIAFLTSSFNFYYFDSNQRSVIKLGAIPKANAINVAQIAFSSISTKIGFVASSNGELLCITESETIQMQSFPRGPNFLLASPDGKSVLTARDRSLNVRFTTRDSSLNLDLKSPISPSCIGFIDYSTLAIGQPEGLVIIHNLTNTILRDFIPTLILQDIDGVRVYSKDYLKTIYPVPKELLDLTKRPLSDRVSKLAESYEKYRSKEIDSYKLLQDIKPFLSQVIKALCDAAPHITEKAHVRRVLEIASFGKVYAPDFDQSIITKTIKICQLLFTLRDKEQGFTTSANQLNSINPADLVSIVAVAHKYPLANALADFYHINKSCIAQDWSYNLIKNSSTNNMSATCSMILKKLQLFDLINYQMFAMFIKRNGYPHENVLQFISCIRDPSSRALAMSNILKLPEKDVVLDIINSRDGDTLLRYLFMKRDETILSYDKQAQVYLSKQESLSSGCNHFQKLLNEFSVFADHYALFRQHIEWHSLEQIQNYSNQKLAICALLRGGPSNLYGRDLKLLQEAMKLENDPNWKDLIAKQQSYLTIAGKIMETMTGPAPIPRELIIHLLKSGKSQDVSIAEKIAKNYQINEKALQWIKIQTYARYHMTKELENTILTRKAPLVPLDRIFFMCLDNGLNDTGLKFLQKHGNNQMSPRIYKEAAAVAREMHNESLARQFDDRAKE